MMSWCLYGVTLCGVLLGIGAQTLYVVSPNTFHLDSIETVAVAVEGNKEVVVQILVQDHPKKFKSIFQTTIVVKPGQPELIPIRLEAGHFPPRFFSQQGFRSFVSLTTRAGSFRKETVIPISVKSGYVFLQMDKSKYKPNERAQMWILYLTDEMSVSNQKFQLQIQNPNGTIVEESVFNANAASFRKAFQTYVYKFPSDPDLGRWAAVVRYGHQLEQNSTTYFELQEYVIPTFTVKLTTPDAIVPSTETISVGVIAKHVYGKNVQGAVTFRLGIRKGTLHPSFFAHLGPKELQDGSCELTVKSEDLSEEWFPEIEGARLVVEATVWDSATGKKETIIDEKGRFTKSPLRISFKLCPRDFQSHPMPNILVEARVTYEDGRTAQGIRTLIRASADEAPLRVPPDQVSDKNGRVVVGLYANRPLGTFTVTLETADPRYVGSQASATCSMQKSSSNAPSIAFIRGPGSRAVSQPGDKLQRLFNMNPVGIQNIYYLVVARGKILALNKLPSSSHRIHTVEIQITHEMAPSFRIVIFAQHAYQLLADSMEVEVAKVCHPEAKVTVIPDFNIQEPGSSGKITFQGMKGTAVSYIGVDEILRRQDLLTLAKVFDQLSAHDLGCGPGGGSTVNSVLSNAGIILQTNIYSTNRSHTCGETSKSSRGKRETALDAEAINHGPLMEDDDTSNLEYRLGSGNASHNPKTGRISSVQQLQLVRTLSKRSSEHEFVSEEEEDLVEKETRVRSDFRETWIFDSILIGPEGSETVQFSLPHSITTWNLQVVSVSKQHGICVSEPQGLTSFKKIFLHLNLPYSAERNQQIEVPVTIFNYMDRRISAVLYLYGTDWKCSQALPSQKSERKRIVVEAQSDETVTFPVIPLSVGYFPIKVVLLTTEGSDVIIKRLNVVPEGVTTEVTVPIKLDPSNHLRRYRTKIRSEHFTDFLDTTQNVQTTSVPLSLSTNFVRGSARSSISVVGIERFFAVVPFSALQHLLRMPGGSGEQNMKLLAPTLYSMRYLKVIETLTSDTERRGYQLLQRGYDNQLSFRKQDGSYTTYPSRPASTWLTAFVLKVFCQAQEWLPIDEEVVCSGLRWLARNQERDGSFVEKRTVFHTGMMGGVEGKIPLTAFSLITLHECQCGQKNVLDAQKKAMTYLEGRLEELSSPLPAAIVAYALILSNSTSKEVANDMLLDMATTDPKTNTMFWETSNSADSETAGYGLLSQLLLNQMDKAASIANGLNTKHYQPPTFNSIQDTVIALQSISEYALRAPQQSLHLVSNLSLSNDENFKKVFEFHNENAFVQQKVKIPEQGGILFISTTGHGVASLVVKMQYNSIPTPGQNNRFFLTVQAIEENEDGTPDRLRVSRNVDLTGKSEVRVRRQTDEMGGNRYKITICVRYLGQKDAKMSIVDVGIFSGFKPLDDELKLLQSNSKHLIDMYIQSSRGIIFILQKVPMKESYCFYFSIVRKQNVASSQLSAVKVYEYSNPDEVTSQFYSPANNRSYLRTFCEEDDVCICAEGGCAKNTFPLVDTDYRSPVKMQEKLLEIFCDDFDIVWKFRFSTPASMEKGFMKIFATIEEVYKEGIEKRGYVENEVRILLLLDSCESLSPGTSYLLMTKDGYSFKTTDGLKRYDYLIDARSVVIPFTTIGDKFNRALTYVSRILSTNGCRLR